MLILFLTSILPVATSPNINFQVNPESQSVLITALIAAIIALITSGVSSYISWTQIQRERSKWLIDLKQAYALEVYKARLTVYPKMQEIIGRLSSQAQPPLTEETAQQVAQEINEWIYSSGGLIAETDTRSAVLNLRDVCATWKQEEILKWRDASLFALRRDLDVSGLGGNPEDKTQLLQKLHNQIAEIQQSS